MEPRLHKIPVVGEVDVGYPCGCGKAPFVFVRIAADGPNIVERTALATHDPLIAR